MIKKDKNIKMVSLDSSTSCSGVCSWINGIYEKSYIVETDKKIKGDEKLNQMIDKLYSIISSEKPDIVVVEMVAVTRNVQSTRMLQELTGAIRGYCVGHNIEYIALRPSEWRKQIVSVCHQKPNGRKREDQKKWSLDIVNNKMGIITESDDQSDAILIGKSYIEMMKGG